MRWIGPFLTPGFVFQCVQGIWSESRVVGIRVPAREPLEHDSTAWSRPGSRPGFGGSIAPRDADATIPSRQQKMNLPGRPDRGDVGLKFMGMCPTESHARGHGPAAPSSTPPGRRCVPEMKKPPGDPSRAPGGHRLTHARGGGRMDPSWESFSGTNDHWQPFAPRWGVIACTMPGSSAAPSG